MASTFRAFMHLATAIPAAAFCNAWQTYTPPDKKCDDPGAKTPFAINLTKAYGPRCPAIGTAPGGPHQDDCCWLPLGYDSGEPFGTPCDKVCTAHGREGKDDAFCQKSDGSAFGNCLCGPSRRFSPRCTSDDDHGWPRFHTLAELKADEQWLSYFTYVYGSAATSNSNSSSSALRFPLCVFDLWRLEPTAYAKSGLLASGRYPPPQYNPTAVSRDGELFGGAVGGYQIYRTSWKPARNHTWVEVMHGVIPTENVGAWAWHMPGSGVWANTGRTIVFPTPADRSQWHHAAIVYLTAGCSRSIDYSRWPSYENDVFGFCAREKGIDSIQFEPQQSQRPMGTFGITNAVEMVLVQDEGMYTCGSEAPAATGLRVGWGASDKCACTNEPIPPTCGLVPDCAILGIPTCSPEPCAARQHAKEEGLPKAQWPQCDNTKCQQWTAGSCGGPPAMMGGAAAPGGGNATTYLPASSTVTAGLAAATQAAAAARAAAAAAMMGRPRP